MALIGRIALFNLLVLRTQFISSLTKFLEPLVLLEQAQINVVIVYTGYYCC